MYLDQQAGQEHCVKIRNKSLARVGQFRYLRKQLTNQNSIHKEMKSGLVSFGRNFYLPAFYPKR
jgi:hypothetical protein